MKRLFSLILIGLATVAYAGNDTIMNQAGNPVPVNLVKGTVTATSTNPVVTVVDNTSTQTAATGTNWVQLASHTGVKQVLLWNTTGTAISFRYGTGTAISIPNNTAIAVAVKANSNEIQIQRTDTSNTQVTLSWHYEG